MRDGRFLVQDALIWVSLGHVTQDNGSSALWMEQLCEVDCVTMAMTETEDLSLTHTKKDDEPNLQGFAPTTISHLLFYKMFANVVLFMAMHRMQ